GLGGVLGSRRGRTRKANTAARAATPAQTSEPRLRPATKARFAASMITTWVLADACPATWRAVAGDCCAAAPGNPQGPAPVPRRPGLGVAGSPWLGLAGGLGWGLALMARGRRRRHRGFT